MALQRELDAARHDVADDAHDWGPELSATEADIGATRQHIAQIQADIQTTLQARHADATRKFQDLDTRRSALFDEMKVLGDLVGLRAKVEVKRRELGVKGGEVRDA